MLRIPGKQSYVLLPHLHFSSTQLPVHLSDSPNGDPPLASVTIYSSLAMPCHVVVRHVFLKTSPDLTANLAGFVR